MSLYEIAKQYRAQGLSVIPCTNKRPQVGTWKQWQERSQTDDDITILFQKSTADQIAVICGKVSGGLEVIDLDLKNDTKGDLWDLLWNDLLEYFNNVMPLRVIQTKSNGIHLYYRCSEIAGNQKLAKLKGAKEAVIETRGEGGYVIAPPSAGYSFLDNRAIGDITEITPEQRSDIMDICRKYNQVFHEERKKATNVRASAYKLTPWDAYDNDDTEPWRTVLQDAGWSESYIDTAGREHWKRPGTENKTSGNWDPAKRLFYIFTSSTDFEVNKAYPPSAIFSIVICAGDFSKAAAEMRKAGYGKPFTPTEELYVHKAIALLDKYTIPDIQRMLAAEWIIDDAPTATKELPMPEREAECEKFITPIIQAAEERNAIIKGLFWKTEVIKGKPVIHIHKRRLAEFLVSQGFRRFVQDRTSDMYRTVKIDLEGHLIEEVPAQEIKHWVNRWVKSNGDQFEDAAKDEVMDMVVDYSKSAWEDVITWIDRISISELSFLRDTKRKSYVAFRNGIVRITSEDIDIIRFSELPDNMLVWKNQIKDRDIEIMGIQSESELNECPVYRFYKRIAGITPDIEFIPMFGPGSLKEEHRPLFDRFMAFMTTFGYLLSNYKDPGVSGAVILAEDTPTHLDGGGAGKDLTMRSLGFIRGVSFIPGKTWKPTAAFAYQTYRMGDDILYIGDLGEYAKFEPLYNSITDGLTVEKKNKDALTIPYELSPKIALSTNFDLDDSATHSARRQFKLLYHKWYNKTDRRVEDELGGQFWSEEWTHRDWMLFYLVLFNCIQLFLEKGVVPFKKTDNLREKSIRMKKNGEEFFEFMSSWIKENVRKWVPLNEVYEEFLVDSSLTDKVCTMASFMKLSKFFCDQYGLVMMKKRSKSRSDGARDQRFVIFTVQGAEVPDFTGSDPFGA